MREGVVPEMFHILWLVNADCDADLESLVRTVFTSLEVVPLWRLRCGSGRHQNHLTDIQHIATATHCLVFLQLGL